MKKVIKTIKHRLKYLAGEAQPEMHDVFVDGFKLKAGDIKDAFGKQACAQFKIMEILQFYADFVVDRTDEEIDEYQRKYEEDHKDD